MKLGDIVKALRSLNGWGTPEVARRASVHGEKVAYQKIQQLEAKPDTSPGYLPQLAAAFDKSIDDLLSWCPGLPSFGPNYPVSQSDATPVHIPRSAFRRVPVVGTASLGMDGYWTDLEYPVGHGDGYFEFPTTDKDAYVLQVRGGSMHPAIRSGWYVVIEPNKQIQMGEFVMVKLTDGRSTVKEFLWHRDGEYVLNAVATNERLVIDEGDIDVIHHVGGILPPSGRQS